MRLGFRDNFVVVGDDDGLSYLTDTQFGSSGSPVCDDHWFVAALHSGSRTAATSIGDVPWMGPSPRLRTPIGEALLGAIQEHAARRPRTPRACCFDTTTSTWSTAISVRSKVQARTVQLGRQANVRGAAAGQRLGEMIREPSHQSVEPVIGARELRLDGGVMDVAHLFGGQIAGELGRHSRFLRRAQLLDRVDATLTMSSPRAVTKGWCPCSELASSVGLSLERRVCALIQTCAGECLTIGTEAIGPCAAWSTAALAGCGW
jgi:hypothetical protein